MFSGVANIISRHAIMDPRDQHASYTCGICGADSSGRVDRLAGDEHALN